MIIFPFNNKNGVVDYLTMATYGEIKDLNYDDKTLFMLNNIHDFRELLLNVGEEAVGGFYLPAIIGLKDSVPIDESRVELQTKVTSELLINKGKKQPPEFINTPELYGGYVGSSTSDDLTPIPWCSDIDGYLITSNYNIQITSSWFTTPPGDQSYSFNVKYTGEAELDDVIAYLKGADSITVEKTSHIGIINAIIYMNMLANVVSGKTYKRHLAFFLNTVFGSQRERGTVASFSIDGNNVSSFIKEEYQVTGAFGSATEHDNLLIIVEEKMV